MRQLLRFRRDRRGNVLLETAFGMAMLATLFMGGIEVARYALLTQKLDRTAMTLGDLLSRNETLTLAEINNIINSIPHIMEPFDFASNGGVVLSAIQRSQGSDPTVAWQVINSDQLTINSQIGALGDEAILPSNLVLNDNENLFVAEVYFNFQTMLAHDLIAVGKLYNRGIFRARLMDTLDIETSP